MRETVTEVWLGLIWLVLRSENDFDADGRATLDEFSDSIFAYVADPGDFTITTESVKDLP